MTVSKQAAQMFNVELSELEFRKQYQIENSNRFAALENLSDSEDINRAWENVTVTIKTPTKEKLGLHELKQHKPWFDGFLDKRKQAKMQWVKDPNQSNADNLNNVRLEASRHMKKRRNV